MVTSEYNTVMSCLSGGGHPIPNYVQKGLNVGGKWWWDFRTECLVYKKPFSVGCVLPTCQPHVRTGRQGGLGRGSS